MYGFSPRSFGSIALEGGRALGANRCIAQCLLPGEWSGAEDRPTATLGFSPTPPSLLARSLFDID
ncbi:hypothetical protein FOMPIDRAFT_150151 [Fomitopsis schrenkii]|uniref:Uncharacterized protein n=1 Tax=Fomitopsis schrenkii TaxID=2126942 RepID=S8DRB2_FOMSC|nr:hypothetical protein FOMPIDRAFT_150151 [Fomitopsis schrenkii]